MYCNKCGKQIEDNSAFCVFCGNKITIIKKQKSTESNEKDASKINNATKKKIEKPKDVVVLKRRDVRRPIMKTLSKIAFSIFVMILIIILGILLYLGIFIFGERNSFEKEAKEIDDDEWEMYDNYLDYYGNELSNEEKNEISSDAKDIKEGKESGYDRSHSCVYYGYGSYEEWSGKFLKYYMYNYRDNLVDDMDLDIKTIVIVGVCVYIVYYVANNSYKERTETSKGGIDLC